MPLSEIFGNVPNSVFSDTSFDNSAGGVLDGIIAGRIISSVSSLEITARVLITSSSFGGRVRVASFAIVESSVAVASLAASSFCSFSGSVFSRFQNIF